MKARCFHCGYKNPGEMRFCGNCGKPLRVTCGNCQVFVPFARYCGNCGVELVFSETASTPKERGSVFAKASVDLLHQQVVAAVVSSEVPSDVAAKMRVTAADMEGERRKVVVLFSDVSGFTAMSEKMDPEQIHSIMNECFAGLVRCIYKYEGYIDKFIGDCIMALFGAPLSHEDDVTRALHAVLEMTEWLKDFSADLERKYGVTLGMHTGLNYGTVIAGGLGSDLRMDYTVIGDTVNVASRLESAAKRGETLVSETVYALGRKQFRFREVEPLTLKGKEHPVPAFELLGVRDDPEPLRGVAEFPKVLVGRDRELELLRNRCRQAMAGQGQVVAVIGSPGVGKSRLISEWVREAEGWGVVSHTTVCLSYAVNTPYEALRRLTLSLCDLREDDPSDRVRQRIGSLGGEGFSEWEPYIRSVVTATEDPQLAVLDGPTRQRMTERAFLEFIAAQTVKHPVLLVWDDLHWIDDSSRRVLDRLVAESSALRLLIVCLFRPEFTPTWGSLPNETRLFLHPLDRLALREVIVRLLEDEVLADQFFNVLAQKSGGNPFFVEEMLQTFLDSGVLVREEGKWKLTTEPKNVSVPDTLHAVIMGRLDSLPEEMRRFLQIGSVIGRSFDAAILAELGWSLASILPFVERLTELQLLEEVSPLPELRWEFKQEFVQMVSYGTLLHRRRRQLHADIGNAMERLYRDRLREQVELLAYHFSEGEVWSKAALYTAESAKKAKELYANAAAIQHYRCLLALAEHEESDDRIRHQLEAYEGLGEVQTFAGDYDAALEAYESLVKTLETVSLDVATVALRRARALRGLGDVHLKRGNLLQSLEYGRRALDVLDGFEDDNVLAEKSRILGQMGFAMFRTGQYEEAERFSQESLELAERLGNDRELAYASLVKGFSFYSRGQLEAASTCYQRALEVRERLGDLSGVAAVLQNLGNVFIDQGRYDDAEKQYRQCLALREKTGDIAGMANVYNQLGNVCTGKGDYVGASEYYTKCRDLFQRLGNRFGLAVTLNNLGQTHIEQNLFKEAREFLRQAESLALALKADDLLVDVQIADAHAALEEGSLDEAASRATTAFQRALQLGNRALEARSRWVLGRIAVERREMETALVELEASLSLFQMLRLRLWEGRALVVRGICRRVQGQRREGNEDLRQALQIFNELKISRDVERAAALMAS